MKKPRYTDSQIMTILKQAETGTPVPALCREHAMHCPTGNCIANADREQCQLL